MKFRIKRFSYKRLLRRSFRKKFLAKRYYKFFRRRFWVRGFYIKRKMFPNYKIYHLAPLWLMNTFLYRQVKRFAFSLSSNIEY